MNKVAVAICVLFLGVCAIEARDCHYESGYGSILADCELKCCGKENDLRCLKTCENITCSMHGDCDGGCCNDGKCGPASEHCDMTGIILAIVIPIIVCCLIAGIAIRYYRHRKRSTAAPRMIILVNEEGV
jgi:cbb3-type cytochrome oxidase subunit 3